MTLNLMLTSRDAVYLCADFRLTSTKDQAALSDSYDTQKLIPVIRGDWSALIAYAGVASAPPLIEDVGQWIVDQVESIPHHGNFSELSSRLLKFDARLGRIRGDRRIAFSVVGFSEQRPFMMLLSNFVDTSGQVVDAGPQLIRSDRYADSMERDDREDAGREHRPDSRDRGRKADILRRIGTERTFRQWRLGKLGLL